MGSKDAEEIIEDAKDSLLENDIVLSDFLEVYEEEKLSDRKSHEKKMKDNKWYVTDLFKCRYKVLNTTPEMKEKTMRADPVISGILMEEALDHYLLQNGYEKQIAYKKEVSDYLISGRMDYYKPELKMGVEFKSPVFVKSKREKMKNYIGQCKSYLWMQDEEHPLEAVELVQMASTGRKEYTFGNAYTDQEIVDLIEEPSYPFFSSECKYCDLKDECIHY